MTDKNKAASVTKQLPSARWHGVDLTDDQAETLDWLREFCVNEIRPNGPKYHKSGKTPYDILKKAAKCGIYSADFFQQLFSDPTGKTAVLAIEELFWADAGIALAIFGTGLPWAAIIANGTPEQIAKWGPECFGTEDNPRVAAFCCSEPHAGSDVSNLKTKAVWNEEDKTWTINGRKDWITNGALKNPDGTYGVHVVIAVVDPALGSRGQASFIVPPGTEGVSLGHKHDKLGCRASHTGEVVFDNVVVPGDCLLGGKEALDARLTKARAKESSGGQAAMATFEGTRWMVAAMGQGVARAACEVATKYSVERTAFGVPIVKHQQVAAMLADMETDIYITRLAIIDAARTYLTTFNLSRAQGSKVKYKATEMAVEVTRNAIQILGGAGYTHEFPVAQWHCDALLLTIFEGTSQIQKNMIASNSTGEKVR